MAFARLALLFLAAYAPIANGATKEQWRSRSIYQVLTDRFARTDGRTDAACNTVEEYYCGGTWKGLISKLDYIKNMGFTAVRRLLPFTSLCLLTSSLRRSGYLPSLNKLISRARTTDTTRITCTKSIRLLDRKTT